MNCFKHSQSTAVGVCKFCNKAVCTECVIDTGEGLACSEVCVKEVKDYNIMMERAKHLYGMTSGGQRVPVHILMTYLIAAIMLIISVYVYLKTSQVEFVSLLMGVSFLVLSVIAHRRNRKIGLSN